MKETTVFTKEKDQSTDFIPETVTSSTGVEVKSKKLGFDLSAFAHLRTVLTELYADAEYAVIRELLSNAIDSHVKAKTDAPVEIELPSAENNYTLTVQDYGTGMSLIEIDERFCNYGGSDKRDDAKTIGRYGLGSKSPLAIANRYDIASIKDGEKVEFHMGSDDFDDASNDFQIHYDNITATDELNGVKIVVPYPKNVYLSPNMLSVLFAGVPNLLVNGKQWNTSLYNEDVFKRVYDVDQNVQMFYNTTEKDARSEFATLNIVLGKVVYPLEIRKLETALYSNSSSEFQEQKEKYQKVLSMVRKLDENTKFKSFFITVPLSFLKPTPSRESLYYTHETVNVMMSFIEKAFTALKEQNEVALNQLNSYKEAREFVYSWQPLFNKEALWRNEKVLLNFDPFYMQKKYNFGHVYKTYTATKTVRHRTVTLKTKELKPIVDNSIDIVNLNPKTLVVQLPLNLIDAAKLMERIKTRFGVIRGEKWEDVLFLPFDYYNNPWWNFSEAYDEEIVTAEQLYRFILKTAKEKRDTVKQEKPLKYNQLVVAVESDPAKKNLIAYRIEPVYKDSEALNKPILYATERDNVNAFTAGDYSYSHRDYWSFYKDNIGDKYTILVVNPRQKLDLFLKTYPDAVRVSEVTKKMLEEKSASKVEVTWNDLSRVLVGYEKTQLEKIMAAYVYCYEAGLVSYYEGLENFVQLKAKTDAMEADTVVELYKNYANGRISVDKITPWGEEARKIINKFSMFSALTQRGEIKYLNEDRVKILASVFVQEHSL